MKLTLESIRARFPNPRVAWTKRDEIMKRGYCVGGAFCKFIGVNRPFPGSYGLGLKLSEVNQQLSTRDAVDFAMAIMDANDSGDFETAWAKLGEALSFGETK